MVSDDYALSLGILLNSEFWDAPYEDREFFFLIGLRNYREKGKYNSFIDVDLAFSHDHVESVTSSYWARDYSLRAYYGLEHFLNKNLGLGGRVGILAGYTEAKQSSSHKYFRGPVSDIALTYYW